ncbi:MAG TPA: hypothetical protein PKL83_04685 [bacterium]|nr:hypothetical protein [bacterium]
MNKIRMPAPYKELFKKIISFSEIMLALVVIIGVVIALAGNTTDLLAMDRSEVDTFYEFIYRIY